jgi:predicted NBD/HSP70 family sugar kinase
LAGAPVTVLHDADLGALGEAVYGAGKDFRAVAYAGIGTGLGMGLVVEKKLVHEPFGFEAGNQIVRVGELSLSKTISGNALKMRFGKEPKDLPREVYEAMTPLLATGLYNTLLHWVPDVLILGGSLMNEENGYRFENIKSFLENIPRPLPALPPLRLSALGDDANLYGARALLNF